MRIDKLRDLLRATPFVPFRIQTSCGARFEVRHPDFLLISPDRLVVTLVREREGTAETCLLDPLHVTHVVLVAAPDNAPAPV